MKYDPSLFEEAMTAMSKSINEFNTIEVDANSVNNKYTELNNFSTKISELKTAIDTFYKELKNIESTLKENESTANGFEGNFNTNFEINDVTSSKYITAKEMAEYLSLCEQYANFYLNGKEVTRASDRARNEIYKKMKAMEESFSLKIFNGETGMNFTNWKDVENLTEMFNTNFETTKNSSEYYRTNIEQRLLHIKNQGLSELEFETYAREILKQEYDSLMQLLANYESDSEEYKILQKKIGYINYAIDRNDVGELWYDIKEDKITVKEEEYKSIEGLSVFFSSMQQAAQQEFNSVSYETILRLDNIDILAASGKSKNTYDLSNLTYVESNLFNILYYYIATNQTDKADAYYLELQKENNMNKGKEIFQDKIDGITDDMLYDIARINTAYANGEITEVQRNQELEIILKELGFIEIGVVGVADGITNWFDGWGKLFNPGEVPSANEYSVMFLQEFLAENYTDNNTGHQFSYNVGSGVGNMLPTIAITVMTAGIMSGAGIAGKAAEIGTKVISAIATGGSSAGHALERNLQAGHNNGAALIEALLEGLSEGALESLIGAYPGMQGVSSSLIGDFLSEIPEEILQDVLSEGLRAVVLGEKFEYSVEQMAETAFYAAIISLFMQGTNITGINETINNFISEHSNAKILLENGTITQEQYNAKVNEMINQIENNNFINTEQDLQNKIDEYNKLIDLKNNNLTEVNENIEIRIKELEEEINNYTQIKDVENDNNKTGSEPTADLFITEKIFETESEVTAELYEEIKTNDNNVTAELNITEEINTQENIIKPNETMKKNELNLKQEIIDSIPNNLDKVSKIRKAYIELNKRLHYSDNYARTKDASLREQIYNKEVSFESLQDNNVICKGWSQLFKELLIDIGISDTDVKLIGGQAVNSHVWVEINLNNGNIIIADATEAITDISGVASNDLVNSKAGFRTVGFQVLPENFSGQGLKEFYKVQQNLKYFEQANNNWLVTDQNIGYVEKGYFNELVQKADQLFGSDINMNINSAKIESIVETIEIPNSMNGLEVYAYFNALKSNIFKNNPNAITLKAPTRTINGNIEIVAMIKYSDSKVMLHSEKLGTNIFDTKNNYENYYNFMTTNGLSQYI